MKVLGIRFCTVAAEAEAVAKFFTALGMPERPLDPEWLPADGSFFGAIFPAGSSWIEVWKEGPGMPVGIMLQIVVDDADAFAANARQHGLQPNGPTDAHGERIYMMQAPGGLQISFQSALSSA